jgi:HlyD family secretion protein
VKKLLAFLIVLGLGLAAVAYWINRSQTITISEALFTYAPVEFGNLAETVSATGAVKPKEILAVGSELSGKVVEIYADVTDVVEEGTPLLKLDDQMATLKLQLARDAVKAAAADIDRALALQEAAQRGLDLQLELKKTGSGLRNEAEKYRAQLAAAKATVKAARVKAEEAATAQKLAQLALDLTVVRVPAAKETSGPSESFVRSGLVRTAAQTEPAPRHKYTVIDRKVVLGQMVAPPASAQLFTLATDLSQMQVHAQVAEGDIAHVQKGLNATFTVSAYSDPEILFQGKVVQKRLVPTSHQGAIYYDAVIDVPNPEDSQTRERRLSPGMTAAVDIILRERQKVWKVPTVALNFQLDQAYQSAAARAKLDQWQTRKDRDDWKPLWVWDRARNSPWPIFVRIGGRKKGQTGIKDSQFNEILDWEPGQEPKDSRHAPQVIINAPPPRRPGLFDQPTNIKFG